MALTRQQYAKAFALNFVFYAIAIALLTSAIGGISGWHLCAGDRRPMVAGSVALAMRALRQIEPVTQRLQFKDRDVLPANAGLHDDAQGPLDAGLRGRN